MLLNVIQIFLVGLVAGEEFVVRYGLRRAMAALPDLVHLQTRIALAKRLKYVVPLIAAFTAYLLFSFFDTVPINMKVNDWMRMPLLR